MGQAMSQPNVVEAARNLVAELQRGNHDARLSMPGELDTLVDALAALPARPCVVVPVIDLEVALDWVPHNSQAAMRLRSLLTAQMPQGEER